MRQIYKDITLKQDGQDPILPPDEAGCLFRGLSAESPRPDLGPDGDQCDIYAAGSDDYGAIKRGAVHQLIPPRLIADSCMDADRVNSRHMFL